MAILEMKRLRLVGMSSERDRMLSELLRLGCVEITEPSDVLTDEELATLVTRDHSETQALKDELERFTSALALLDKYTAGKKAMFPQRRKIGERLFFSEEGAELARETENKVHEVERGISELYAELGSLQNLKLSFEPWETLDLPVETESTENAVICFGTVNAATTFEELRAELAEVTDACEVELVSENEDMLYLSLVCYRPEFAEVEAVLHRHGWTEVKFIGFSGLVRDNIAVIGSEIERVNNEITKRTGDYSLYYGGKEAVELQIDRITQEIARQKAHDSLLLTDSAFIMEGWLPAENEQEALRVFGEFPACCLELEEPAEEEFSETPVKLKNNPLTEPLNMVTEMYSLPAYGTIDPNPLMAPFFVLFYGIMMADMGYGLLMLLGSVFMYKVMHVRDSAKNFAGLLGLCGISTFVVGALTGGFFGDFIPQLAKLINPDTTLTALPALFTPLDDTIAILIGSLVLGVIQIFTGMTVSVIYKVKHGNFIDALFSEITWWIILGGVAMAIFGVGNVHGIPVVLIVGALMLALGGTRDAHGFGKLTSLVGLVYNGVSGYFSDILSYARLMALMLAGSVISQVFNTLGSVIGNVVGFVIISLIGNALNFALNLLGCYVHDLRLQCLEFFNRFYTAGGRAFKPLSIKTKYTDIIEEDV